ncbi:type IV secretion system DNA-binding domain-containing protein [Candidatus Peregrinibacteria bacterium]|nr:type IV secretion system DNA-binding domain-containing protein [Candidatus Peregrinibacteria bacterium]
MVAIARLLIVPILLLIVELVSRFLGSDFLAWVWHWYIQHPFWNLLLVWLYWEIYKLIIYDLRFYYAWWKAKSLVTMKVMLPRSDSKIDQERRTEKDFKEKVAVMEQLYRALWEVKSLSFWQFVHFWIFRFATISFEMYVEKGELIFYVITQPSLVSIVEKQITAFYPDAEVSLQKTPDIWPKGSKLIAYNMRMKKRFFFPIRFYEEMQDDPLNDVANVLSKLDPDEEACIQLIITPVFTETWSVKVKRFASLKFKGKSDHWTGKIPILSTLIHVISGVATGTDGTTFAPGATHGDSFIRMIQPEEELYKRMGQKAGMSGFHASVRILVSAKTWKRADDIASNTQVAFNVFKDVYGNWFSNHRMFVDFLPHVINAPIMHWLWKNRINGFIHRRNLMVEKELAGLYHFPDSRYNKIPIIQWISYKVLPPPPNAPKEGILIGINRHRAVETPIRFLRTDRTRHQYIIGKSGCGKSALLSWQSRQDISANEGLCVVDPHGDLIEDCLAHVPKERAKDVVVFDPSDIERPMGLNLLEAKTPEEKDRASLDAMEIFIKLFGNEIFGPRIQHYFRNGCLTLMDDEEEGATLIDVPRLYVDDEFQRYKVSKCKNVVVRSFWEHEIAKTGAREKEEMIPYFSAKFGPFVTNSTMRNIIGQPKSAFSIRKIMDDGKVLLVNLSKGKIGDVNAQLLGLIFVNKVNMAALSRADTPQKDRKRFYLYVDEFQNFITDAFATILSEARKYELALIMAHQYIGQLVGKTAEYEQASTKMRDAVFGNVGTIMSFKIGAEDAEYMAKEMAPVLSEQDVIGIPNFHCYCKLNINNTTSRPFSIATIYDESNRNDKLAALVKEYSRMKFGRKRVFVDQEIEDRIGIIRNPAAAATGAPPPIDSGLSMAGGAA